jgi:mannitol-1-/sugar-/sorbitol-6-/2-deoxyglucose-6-phosphatase
MIKAVIFDMDGLLIDSEPTWQKLEKELYASLGIQLTVAEKHEMMGTPALENAKRLYARYGWEKYSPEEVAKMLEQKVAAAFRQGIELMPGVDQALQICKRHNLPVAIASSSPMVLIETVVDTLKLREHFKHIYSAQHEPLGKPHPGVFISVGEKLGVAPDHCLVFENSPAGVLAAKAAKMHCVAVPTPDLKQNKFIQTADLVLDSLEEFSEESLTSF